MISSLQKILATLTTLTIFGASSALALDTIVVFNEVQYHPADANDPSLEFIELYNQNAVNIDLTGWRISGEVDFSFPAGTTIEGGSYLVIASDPTALEAASGNTGFHGPFTGTLGNGGATLRIRNNNNRLLDELTYNDRSPWPIGADGSGASLSKISPQKSTAPTAHWKHSLPIGGTPGTENFPTSSTPTPSTNPKALPITINEVAGTADASFWIELHNSGASPQDISNFLLTFEDGDEYQIPPATTIPANDHLLINTTTLALATPPLDGENLYLYQPSKVALIDALRLDDLPRARFPDGSDQILTVPQPTQQSPNAPNNITTTDAIVINEIMYHHRLTYPTDGDPPIITIVPALDWSATWRFNQSGSDLGSAWASSNHPVSGNWESGPGPLGYETTNGIPPIPLATQLTRPQDNTPRVTTFYFETDFNITDASEISSLNFSHLTDDGAVYYLNGQEIHRFDMPTGSITSSTLAVNNTAVEADQIRTFTVDPTHLITGQNRLSVEVHQSSTGSNDIVMGLKLDLAQATPGNNPPTAFKEIKEEWIELYNRSAATVSLDNWELAGAVDFTFPAGTQIPSGSYLVIARDLADFSAKFPGITALGDYSGSLTNSGDQLSLLDQSNNPVDQVAYLDGAPWPKASDGGGSSLELRHPELDNSAPTAWAASSNETTSDWQTYTYNLTSHTPTYRPDQNNFHEIRLGLLDRGQVLIDDLSVIEDPAGLNLELIENGTFSNTNDWRILGTHQNSHIENNALKIVATSRFNYLNNLIETNLTNGGSLRPVNPGTEYQISFRAKWLSGTPQLRFEFYYNKLAQLVTLDQPQTHGTPGAQNSTYTTTAGPTLTSLLHQPAVPTSSEPINISVNANDPDGLSTISLKYSINAGTFQTASMTSTDGQNYTATLPTQSNNALIQFYVQALDQSGNTTFAPPLGPDSRALIKVTTPNSGGSKQSVRVNMLSAEANAMHVERDILDNKRRGCTIILNEDEIAYDSGIRLRGSMFSRRRIGRVGFNLKLPADHLFRGVHSTITLRNGLRREIAVKHIINAAGGLHDNYNDIVQFNGHLSAYNSLSRLEMTRFGGNYLDGLPGGNGPDGPVFKMEGIRVFQATQDGTPDTPKLPFPIGWVPSYDLADQGDLKEDYRHSLRINSNLDQDDYSDIIEMAKLFSLSVTALENAAPNIINVDMWCRQFAMLSLCGIRDTYSQGNAHNLNFYCRPDGIVDPMPWDWDNNFGASTTASLWGNRNVAKLFARPAFTRLYHGHLHDIVSTTFNSSYLTPWLTHLGTCSDENYTSSLSYINGRGNYVLSQLPTQIPLTITSNNGNDFDHNNSTVTLTGTAWIDAKEIIIAGTSSPLPLTWLDAQTFEVQVPLLTGANLLTLTALDYQGNPTGSDNITVTNTSTTEPASAANLVISEIHYHPADNDLEEFIELQNISTTTIDLSSVTFTAGIDFEFPANTLLLPGERILVVIDLPVFQAKYGTTLNVAGTFNNLTKLSNKGETIRLESPTGVLIQEVTYNDNAPWPTSSDGNGPSLVLINPTGNPDHNLATNWRQNTIIGGTPGSTDAILFTGRPLDQSTLTINVAGHWEFTFQQALNADNVIAILEYSNDLVTWTESPTIADLSDEILSGTILSKTYTSILPANQTRKFVRVRYQPR